MASVSVIIPTYNRAALLRKTIDSVLAQSFKDYEILIVDDGSSDDTPEIEGEYGAQIRYFRQQNKGVNAARNLGLQHATGKYIAPLDSDDLWRPWFLGLMVGLLEHFPASGFAYCDFEILRGDSPPHGPGLMSWQPVGHEWSRVFDAEYEYRTLGLAPLPGLDALSFAVYTGDIYAASLHAPQVMPGAALIRKQCIGDLRFPVQDSFSGDWEFFARLSHKHGAVYADTPAALNRSHEDAVRLTRTDPSVILERRINQIDRIWRQDAAFMTTHGGEVDSRQSGLLVNYAKLLLLAGNSALAGQALRRARTMQSGSPDARWLVLRGASVLPGSSIVLKSLRYALARLRSLAPRQESP